MQQPRFFALLVTTVKRINLRQAGPYSYAVNPQQLGGHVSLSPVNIVCVELPELREVRGRVLVLHPITKINALCQGGHQAHH